MRTNSFSTNHSGSVDLPLVVPSFSSKGFKYFTDSDSKEIRSETSVVLESMGGLLQEAFLISAFDLYHKHYSEPTSYFANTALIFVDSGGYELNPEFDSSEPKITPVRDLEFDNGNYLEVLEQLHSENPNFPLVIANFDWGTKDEPLVDQVREARRLYRKFPAWASSFILKPDTPKSGVIHVKKIVPVAEELRDFDVIGVTEKELGKGLIDRLKRLARLRVALWDQDITTPIHVWGGMDPLVTPLYYFAGADIFDGVSWLRYSYFDGLSTTMDGGPILRGQIETPHDHSEALTRLNNLNELQELAVNLRIFGNSVDLNFEIFGSNAEVLKRAYDVMSAKIPRFEELR